MCWGDRIVALDQSLKVTKLLPLGDGASFRCITQSCSFFLLSTIVLLGKGTMSAFFFYCVKEGGARGIRGAPATVSFNAKTNTPDSLVMTVQPGPTGTPHCVEA